MTRHVGFVIFEDFQLLDAAGPIAAFEIAGRYAPGAYDLATLAPGGGAVRSSSGATMNADGLAARAFDTLVVAGGDGSRRAIHNTALLDFLRAQMASTRRVWLASVRARSCSPAAGLLDGRRATTHWSRTQNFRARFPNVRLEPDRIFVRDGPVWTSAGITAGIDLALALIADDLGEEIARSTARQLVVYRRRPGGQSQFSALIENGAAGGAVRPAPRLGARTALRRARRRAAGRQARDEPAQFRSPLRRRDGADAGAGDRAAPSRKRARKNRGVADPIESIAPACGFGDPERMRRAFLRAYGQPPQALRRTAARRETTAVTNNGPGA